MEHKTVGFAVCGSFCTHHRAMEALEAVKARYDHVIPIVSEVVADTDTRFGTAHDLMREMERICDHRVIATQKEAEPIGPKGLLDLLTQTVVCIGRWHGFPPLFSRERLFLRIAVACKIWNLGLVKIRSKASPDRPRTRCGRRPLRSGSLGFSYAWELISGPRW